MAISNSVANQALGTTASPVFAGITFGSYSIASGTPTLISSSAAMTFAPAAGQNVTWSPDSNVWSMLIDNANTNPTSQNFRWRSNGAAQGLIGIGYDDSGNTAGNNLTLNCSIATGKIRLADSTGTAALITAALAQFTGNVQAGSSGGAGTVTSFPATAANGSLILAAVDAGANNTTTISNGAMGQSTVYTIGDIGAGTGGIVVGTSNYRMKCGNQVVVAGGMAAQTVTDAFCTSGSTVVASWNDTSNAVSILTVAAGDGSFVVTSSGDPGASHINYIITK